MVDKSLKKLSRAELLELLLEQTREVEQLREKLEAAESALNERRIKTENAGNLARAVLEINDVMAAAQAAAEQYLENIEIVYEEARSKCDKMIADAEKMAEEIKKEAWSKGMADSPCEDDK